MQYIERLCSCGTKIRSGKHCLECLHGKMAKQEREYHFHRRRSETKQEAERK